MSETREWQYCAYCGNEVDTGWECDRCGFDWLPFAYPWRERLLDWLKRMVPGLDRQK